MTRPYGSLRVGPEGDVLAEGRNSPWSLMPASAQGLVGEPVNPR